MKVRHSYIIMVLCICVPYAFYRGGIEIEGCWGCVSCYYPYWMNEWSHQRVPHRRSSYNFDNKNSQIWFCAIYFVWNHVIFFILLVLVSLKTGPRSSPWRLLASNRARSGKPLQFTTVQYGAPLEERGFCYVGPLSNPQGFVRHWGHMMDRDPRRCIYGQTSCRIQNVLVCVIR